MRHCRDTISKDVKTALFKVCKVPEIKSNAGSKIAEWKATSQVIEAYSNLWKSDNNGLVTINNIITKAMPKEKESCLTPSIIAFTLAVCCIVLNLHSNEIKCTEESVKKRYNIFLVSIISFHN